MAGLKKILAGLVTGHNWLLPALLFSTASVWFYWVVSSRFCEVVAYLCILLWVGCLQLADFFQFFSTTNVLSLSELLMAGSELLAEP
jgi:hypothetical protein